MNNIKLMRQAFRYINHEWHVFYMFDLALQAERHAPLIKCMADIMRKAIIEKKRKWGIMRQINIRKQLEQMLDLGFQFREMQKKALKAIMR
jgi:hypothetical protein